MAVTVESLKTRFPEFAGSPDSVLQIYLNEASRLHNDSQWADKSDDALSYLAAHISAVFGAAGTGGAGCGGAPGPITSEREGQVAVSYAVSTRAKESGLGSTKYGRRYLQLVKTAFPRRCI